MRLRTRELATQIELVKALGEELLDTAATLVVAGLMPQLDQGDWTARGEVVDGVLHIDIELHLPAVAQEVMLHFSAVPDMLSV